MRWVLVEATTRILPEVSRRWAATPSTSCSSAASRSSSRPARVLVGGHVVLDDGTEYDCETIVWTAGVKPNPVLQQTDLPIDDKGRLKATAELTVDGVDARLGRRRQRRRARPDQGETGATTGPSAQHAVRQAKQLADNLVAVTARAAADALPARLRRLGRVARAAQGRRRGLRRQAHGSRRVVHAPLVPPGPGAHPQPQGEGDGRLDARAVLPPRDRLARLVRRPQEGVRRGLRAAGVDGPREEPPAPCGRAGAAQGARPRKQAARPPRKQ